MRTVLTLVLLGLLPFAVSVDCKAASIIDDFSKGSITIVADEPNANLFQAQDGLGESVLLGRRTVTLQGDINEGSIQVDLAQTAAGVLDYISNSPVFRTAFPQNRTFDGRVILDYLPGNRATSYDLLSLVDGDVFAVDVLRADFGELEQFPVAIGLNGLSEVGRFHLHSSESPYTVLIPFSDLTSDIVPLSLNNVRSLRFDFGIADFVGIPPDASFTLSAIRVVPEPASALLLVPTLAFLAVFSSRHRRACSPGLPERLAIVTHEH